ncbi:MAG: hypothetical protein QXL43_01015 [Methanolinea sp.]|nr:hypothetical protein [Methanolinea sp.]
MTLAEVLLLLILIALIAFALYYFLRGSSGRIDIARPIESRIDEYLDRKFDRLVEEWGLVGRPVAERFRDENLPLIAREEERMAALRKFEREFGEELASLEERIEALEKQVPR